MKTLIKISIIFILALAVSAFVSNSGMGQYAKDLSARSTTFNNPLVTYGPELDSPVGTLNESFESATFPPPGWIKLNPDGGTGWNRQTAGTTPIPGWIGGTITTPPGGGVGVAFATWNTGGAVSNNQWLVTPQLKNYYDDDSLSFWLRFWPAGIYSDTVDIKISTTTPTVAAFTINVATIVFPRNSADTNWTEYKYRLRDLITTECKKFYIAFVERVADNLNDGASVSLDLVSVFSSNTCDPGTPHIEVLDYPGTPPGSHMEGRYVYSKSYLPYYPNDTEFVDTHCGLNTIKTVDPCNPWILTFYVAYFEDERDLVKVARPNFNWNTDSCQTFEYDVVWPTCWTDADFWDPLVPGSGFYHDSVVIKYTMTPHTIAGCIPDPSIHPPQPWYGGPGYICYNWDTIYNWNCWRDCMHERLLLECIDFCEVPDIAMCNMEWDKALPVELTSFTAIAENENVVLAWTTATEKDNSGFDIERRTDGIWAKIGFVEGKGNSEIPTDYTFIDNKLNSESYSYRLKQIDFNGNVNYFFLTNSVNIGVPSKFSISQNYPNPFNPATKIDFALPNDGNVMMKIYDLSGREIVTVMNEFRSAGYYTIDFNAANLASGIYYYKITAGNNTAVNKMVVIK